MIIDAHDREQEGQVMNVDEESTEKGILKPRDRGSGGG